MTAFESKTVIDRPVNEVYNYLADFNNHRQLMPDSIQNWASSFNEASFDIQNMAKLSLQINERVENEAVNIIAVGKPPFEVTLNWALAAQGQGTAVTFTITANLNMMMKMLASAPLQKLADHETQSLAALVK